MFKSVVRFWNVFWMLAALTLAPKASAAQVAAPKTSDQASQVKSPQEQALDLLAAQFTAQPNDNAKEAFVSSPGNFASYLAVSANAVKAEVNAQLFHRFEEQRIDKQVTTSSSSGGSTSASSKGSVPWLFGFAVEHGALTQSEENNQIVFRGNIANAISALKFHDYISSYDHLQQENALIRNLSKTSFSISFNPAQNNSSSVPSPSQQNSLAGASAHYDIYNHRDPRDPRWGIEWADVRRKMGALPNATAAFRRTIEVEAPDWPDQTRQAFRNLGPNPTNDQVRAFLKQIADDLVTRFGSIPDVKAAAQSVANALISARQIEDEAYSKIMQSPTVSFEYSYVRQSANQVPNTIHGAPVSVTSSLPDLSNFNVIANAYLVAGSQLTLNANTTIFDSIPIGSKVGRVRDFRFSAQVDIPLPDIANVGKPTLTFSGLFVDLLNEPLGQQLLINSVAESRTGPIGLFQSKVTIPVKGSGVKIPFSLTVSNRTELVKESDVRGTIGVTFDLDSIFSKPQQQ
jgi:hypothetical protein